MSYRNCVELKDEYGNEIELRERWINPEDDVWAWFLHKEGNDDVNSLNKAGGMRFHEALAQAAKYFKRLEDDILRTKALREEDDFEMSHGMLPEPDATIQKQFRKIYALAEIDFKHHLDVGVESITKYIRKRTESACNLYGSRDFAPGVRLYPSGMLKVECNGHSFKLSIFESKSMMAAYYKHVMNRALLKQCYAFHERGRVAFMQKYGIVPLNRLLKGYKSV